MGNKGCLKRARVGSVDFRYDTENQEYVVSAVKLGGI
jgi:hypothetical protein